MNCVCHSIRSMFRVLGMYNFVSRFNLIFWMPLYFDRVGTSFRPTSPQFLPFHFDWLSPLQCTTLYDSIANCLRTERPSFFQNQRSRRFSLSLPFLKWKWAVLSHFLFCTFRLPVQSFIKLLIVRTENRTKGSKIEVPLVRKISQSSWILHGIEKLSLLKFE